MKNSESKLNLFLVGALSLILGVILIIATDKILTAFNYAFVCIFLLISVIEIVGFIINKDYKIDKYNSLIVGIVFLWLSLIMYQYYMIFINILPIIFSLYLFIMGALLVLRFLKFKHIRYIIMGILSIIVGILLIFEPKFGAYTYLKITGVDIILISIMYFYELIKLFKVKNNA